MTSLTELLDGERYLSLTTFRSSGDPVSTPVWFAPDTDGSVLVYVEVDSGKVRRLQQDPSCEVAACDRRGSVHGPTLQAYGTIIGGPDATTVRRAIADRYGWQWTAFDLLWPLRNRGRGFEGVGVRLRAADV